ncbi:hypothetical protein KL86DPRO_11641 [uncultured delta proteobacterium]|uniref:Uncharacterized protein n=1 Tax=uncultured delta proteobacterium TaxID=34034 RepID=A0A212JJN0_9DELT|nr:hypothetical protein KL86DPRO_11641 [uncultured delta proteobacterium]
MRGCASVHPVRRGSGVAFDSRGQKACAAGDREGCRTPGMEVKRVEEYKEFHAIVKKQGTAPHGERVGRRA